MKKIISNKYFIIAIVLVIIAISCFLIFKKNNKITNLEKIKVEETSLEIADYLDEVTEHNEEKGKYICFAIEYLYNKLDKNTFTASEVVDVINKYFNEEYDMNTVFDIGVTPYMADKGIVLDRSNASYTYNKTNVRSDIAATPIVKYELDSIKKINNNTFEATFNKYVVEKPYEILNYYNNKNISNSKAVMSDSTAEAKIVSEYLKGNSKVIEVKKLITKDNISKIGKKDKKITIKYIVKEGNLRIEKIK